MSYISSSKKPLALITVALLIAYGIPNAFAADDDAIEEVVVTGSHIKKGNENQSVPVDVFDRSEFESQGSPSIEEIVQNMPAISGTVNRSEQYTSGGLITGTKNVNIRGMGIFRTLVLLNGKRMNTVQGATNQGEYGVDIGLFPNISLQRIELLKNGGSTAYGSSAIAGVFNFITRENFEGFEFRASHASIDNSDGDDEVAFIFGVGDESFNWVTSFEYQERNKLEINEGNLGVDVTPADGSWPWGYTSLGNPAAYLPAGADGKISYDKWGAYGKNGYHTDPACGNTVGDATSFLHPSGDGRCSYYYSDFANLIDPQDRIKVFSQITADLTDDIQLYGDLLYSRLNTTYTGAPSYPPTNDEVSPWGNSPIIVHPDNPGLINFVDGLGGDAADAYSNGAVQVGRVIAIAGVPITPKRYHDNTRLVIGARGALPFAEKIDFDISITYSGTTYDVRGQDTLSDRYDQAVAGLGGAGCNYAATNPLDPLNDASRGNSAMGCSWWNPFGSSIGASASSPLSNDQEIFEWFSGESSGITRARLMVTDIVFTGEAPIELAGGAVLWAAGAQNYWFKARSDMHGDNRVDHLTNSSPFHFLGTTQDSETDIHRYSFFGELSVPVLEDMDIELGARYTNWDVDSIVKPKIAMIWDFNDWITLRASYEETIIVPTIPSQPSRSLQRVGSEYITIEVPIPDSLDPEQSDNWNIGIIAKPMEGLLLGADVYQLDLNGPFSTESINGGQSEWVYNGDALIKIITESFNGGSVTVEGVDIRAEYNWDIDYGAMQVGMNGTITTAYDIDNQGVKYDALGKYNNRSSAPFVVRSVPEEHINAWVGLNNDRHSIRLYARYISSMEVAAEGLAAVVDTIDSHLTWDAHYTFTFMEDMNSQVTISAVNLTDEEPPLAPHEIAYDAFSHSPIGRVVKFSYKYTM